MPDGGRKEPPMTKDPDEAIRLIQCGLDKLGHAPGTIDGQWVCEPPAR